MAGDRVRSRKDYDHIISDKTKNLGNPNAGSEVLLVDLKMVRWKQAGRFT